MSSEAVVDAKLVKHFRAERDSAGFELDVHLRCGPGVTVLFGSSGAGKSLTLNCLGGFARPDAGRILIGDQLYFDAETKVHVPPERRRCGYIFQDHALFPHMTVRENLGFAAASAPKNGSARLHRYRRIQELLELFELGALAARMPAQLSGGQKQRAALARVLASEPRLLLLDEPTRGLDARLRTGFYDVLRKTRERLSVPAILVTHDLEECFELADSVYLMDHGRFLQTGSPETVLEKPASVDVARMLGIYNLVPAEIAALDPEHKTSKLAVADQVLNGPYFPAHLIGDRGWACFREREMKVMPVRDTQENNFALRVRKTSPVAMGVRLEFEHEICATVTESEWQRLRGTERLWVKIPAMAIHFIG